jgi:hypothetical protein
VAICKGFEYEEYDKGREVKMENINRMETKSLQRQLDQQFDKMEKWN